MSTSKIVGMCILAIVIVFALLFGFTNLELWWKSYFDPKFKNVEREVFEETKSYTHGAIQDLANYYGQYKQAQSVEDQQTIAEVVKVRFSEFDANSIKSLELRQFLKNIRGY